MVAITIVKIMNPALASEAKLKKERRGVGRAIPYSRIAKQIKC
jgi:hypothetical protein